jgi:hypothetical protein
MEKHFQPPIAFLLMTALTGGILNCSGPPARRCRFSSKMYFMHGEIGLLSGHGNSNFIASFLLVI